MDNPLVSVVIPCYNADKFIGDTIRSVIGQDFQDWELIVVNDGSCDNSEKIIQTFNDERIRYFYKENSGVADTRNFGISIAKAPLIAFLDADDLFQPENLSLKVAFLLENVAFGFVHSQEIKFDATQELETTVGQGGDVLDQLLAMQAVIHSPSSVIVRKNLLVSINCFDIKLSTSADWDLWVRLSNITKLGFIEKPLVKYRLHSNQMHSNIPLMEKDMLYALKKFKENNLFKMNNQKKYCFAKLYLILAACYRKDHVDYKKFFKYLIYSFFTNPLPIFERLFNMFKKT